MAKKKKRAKRKQAKKKTRRKKKTTRRKRVGRNVNKSEAIRSFLAANPGAGPSKAVKALSSKGINVSSALVSQVKGRMGKPGRRAGRPRGAARTAGRSRTRNDMFAMSDLLQAKKLAAQLGSTARAKAALEALEKLEA